VSGNRRRRNDYGDEPTLSELEEVRYLHFDSPWIQGAMSLRQPQRLCLAYTQQMMAWMLFTDLQPEQTVTQLGLGAGSITRFCLAYLKNPLVVVERSYPVIQVCHQYFRVPLDPRLSIVEDDAAKWVADPANRESCAVLMVDLYDRTAQGPVCDSLQFYRKCFSVLEPSGVMSVNLFGQHESYEKNLQRIGKVFSDRLLLLPPAEEGNQVVLAFKGDAVSWNRDALMSKAEALEKTTKLPARRWVRSLGKITSI